MRKEIHTAYHFAFTEEEENRLWFTVPVLIDSREIRYANGIMQGYDIKSYRSDLWTYSIAVFNGVNVNFCYENNL